MAVVGGERRQHGGGSFDGGWCVTYVEPRYRYKSGEYYFLQYKSSLTYSEVNLHKKSKITDVRGTMADDD